MDDEQGNKTTGVTMLFAMKWFNSDLTNKGMRSELVKGLLIQNQQEDGEQIEATTQYKLKSDSELLALCYLVQLESNNYLKSNQKYLFGDLVQSTNRPEFQEQVFLFLEMLKVFFPGGDDLVAPKSLSRIENLF